jgi:hypothetical protein
MVLLPRGGTTALGLATTATATAEEVVEDYSRGVRRRCGGLDADRIQHLAKFYYHVPQRRRNALRTQVKHRLGSSVGVDFPE